MTLTITLETSVDPDNEKAVRSALSAFNETLFGPANAAGLQITLRNDEGEVVGGLIGQTWFGFLYTRLLFVPEEARGQGFGARLLARAEEEGRRRGCKGAYIDTMSEDARRVYERCGYRPVGHMPGMGPNGMTWLAKDL